MIINTNKININKIQYKIHKYNYRLNYASDPKKIDTYKQKIYEYTNMSGGADNALIGYQSNIPTNNALIGYQSNIPNFNENISTVGYQANNMMDDSLIKLQHNLD